MTQRATLRLPERPSTAGAPQERGRSTKQTDRAAAMYRWRPDLFNPRKPVPLAVGIYHALVADKTRPITGGAMRTFLWHWVRRTSYLRAILEQHERVDHQGARTPISAEAKAMAARLLAERAGAPAATA